ncbi:hypothetical protein M1271_07270 [Patescibacteria group bacterium]|nr:hypothetical protein [Patescibacteria group bacterium]
MDINIKTPKITSEEIKQLVIERLRRIPPGKKISIGSEGDFTGEELIKLVETDKNIGGKIIEMQLDYLRSLKDLLNEDLNDHHPSLPR